MSKKGSKDDSNSKPIFKKWWFWVIILIIIAGVGSAASNKEPQKVGDNGSSSSSSSAEKDTFAVGDVISYDGKEITVVSVKRNYDTGNQFLKPENGNEFVKISIKIENKSNEKISYNSYDWELQDSDGDIKSCASIQFSEDGALGSGDLAAGGKKSGDLYFEVPKGDSGLILHYKSSFWSDKTVNIKL